jgi:glycosyltransferase involved in cell wall biosynthesis
LNTSDHPEGLPLVSIVIPTYNSQRTLDRCLRSITEQNYPDKNIEVMIIDKNSGDLTQEIARSFSYNIMISESQRSAARNIGIRQSKGRYVLYLDSDMILSASLVKECVSTLEDHNNLIALYIPERVTGTGLLVKLRDFERQFYNGTCIDAIRFLRKDQLLAAKGFDESLVAGEDWDLDRRIRHLGKVGIVSSPLFHDEGTLRLQSYINRKTYYSSYIQTYINKWGHDDPVVKRQLGWSYRLLFVFLENGKWKALLRKPHLALGVALMRTLIGFMFMFNSLRWINKTHARALSKDVG